jgi:hypothetical protein
MRIFRPGIEPRIDMGKITRISGVRDIYLENSRISFITVESDIARASSPSTTTYKGFNMGIAKVILKESTLYLCHGQNTSEPGTALPIFKSSRKKVPQIKKNVEIITTGYLPHETTHLPEPFSILSRIPTVGLDDLSGIYVKSIGTRIMA